MKEQETETMQFSTLFELSKYFGDLALPIKTGNDIRRITEKQEWFNSKKQLFWLKLEQGNIKDETEEQKQSRADVLYLSSSGVTKKEIAFLTLEMFTKAIKDAKLNNKEVFFLSYWLLLQEEEKQDV